jgi:hypothetical protein
MNKEELQDLVVGVSISISIVGIDCKVCNWIVYSGYIANISFRIQEWNLYYGVRHQRFTRHGGRGARYVATFYSNELQATSLT